MADKAHLESLSQRHQELEAEIADELKHPGYDDLHLVELKRQKLRVKDQLEELRAELRVN